MSRLMARLEKVFGASALVLLAATAAAQTRPDFSGRWTVAPEPSAAGAGRGGSQASGTIGSGWGGEITITQNAATLTVERAQFSQYDMQPSMRFTYALDGSESRNTINMGRGPQELASKATWRETSLVISTGYAFSNPQSGKGETLEVRQELSLDAEGSLVVTTTRSGPPGGQATATTTKYVKNSGTLLPHALVNPGVRSCISTFLAFQHDRNVEIQDLTPAEVSMIVTPAEVSIIDMSPIKTDVRRAARVNPVESL